MNNNGHSLLENLLETISSDTKIIDEKFYRAVVRLFFTENKSTDILILLRKYLEIYLKLLSIYKNKQKLKSFIAIPDYKVEIIEIIGHLFREQNNEVVGQSALDLMDLILLKAKSKEAKIEVRTLVERSDLQLSESDIKQLKGFISSLDKLLELYLLHQQLKDFVTSDSLKVKSVDEYIQKMYELSRSTVNIINRHIITSNEDNKPMSVSTASEDFLDMVDKSFKSLSPEESIPTGYPKLDKILSGGFQRQRIYTLVGLPGSGKSTILLNLALNVWDELSKENDNSEKKKVVYYITLENSVEETLVRLALAATKNPAVKENRGLLKKVLDDRSNVEFLIEYYKPRTIGPLDILNRVKEIEGDGSKEVAIVVIDYLGKLGYSSSLSSYDRMAEWEKLGYVSDDLKYLALSSNMVVLTVHQFNRGAKERGRSAGHESMGGSWKIVENFDVIIYAYRNDDEETDANNNEQTSKRTIELSVKKNRFGPDGVYVSLGVDFNTWSVETLSPNFMGDLRESSSKNKVNSGRSGV